MHAIPVDACVINVPRRSHLRLYLPLSGVPKGKLWCRLTVAQRDVHKRDAAAEVAVIVYKPISTNLLRLLASQKQPDDYDRRRTDFFRDAVICGCCSTVSRALEGEWIWIGGSVYCER